MTQSITENWKYIFSYHQTPIMDLSMKNPRSTSNKSQIISMILKITHAVAMDSLQYKNFTET
jgi:hypothetical protein